MTPPARVGQPLDVAGVQVVLEELDFMGAGIREAPTDGERVGESFASSRC